jgi:hypothetical protein
MSDGAKLSADCPEGQARLSAFYRGAPFVIVALGVALVGFGYWPGIMTDDARWQYQQVVDNAYEDWHPPFMAWLWRQLTFVHGGPAPMLVLQLLLYWTGFLLIASAAYRRSHRRLGIAVACAGFLPAPFALTGTVTKDALMAGLLLCATGLLLWRDLLRSAGDRAALAVGTILILLVASALRFNAFLACVPLAVAVLPPLFTRTKFRLLIAALVATAAFMTTGPVVTALVQAEDTDVQLSLMIFDLGGITEHTGVSQFPDMGVGNPTAVNHRCYDVTAWDSYSSWAKRPCPMGFDRFQSLIDDDDVDARALWLHAIAAHPVAYAEHRLAHFNQATYFLIPEGPTFTAWSQSVPNPWNFHVRPNAIISTVTAVADAAAHTPLSWPISWIGVSLAALILALAGDCHAELIAVAASAFFYGAGYLFFSVASGMRYHLWTISGAAVAALLIAGELWPRRRQLPRSAIAVAVILVILPALLAAAARVVL